MTDEEVRVELRKRHAENLSREGRRKKSVRNSFGRKYSE